MQTQDYINLGIVIVSLITAIATVILALITQASVQVIKSNSRGDFLLRLDEAFRQYQDIRAKLRDGGDWHRGANGPKFPEDLSVVEGYLALFERVQLLVEERIIDINIVEKLYGDRLFNIVINPIIYQKKLVDRTRGWSGFIKLWAAVERTRQASRPHRWLPNPRPSPDKLLEKLRHTEGVKAKIDTN